MDKIRKRNLYIILSLSILTLGGILYFILNRPTVEDEQPEPCDSTCLKVGVIPSIECLPFYVAERYGLSDSIGLPLRVVSFDSSMDADTAFVNHDIDCIASDMVKLSVYQSNGDSVSGIMGGDWNLSLVTSRQSRINNIKGLKEKVIAGTRHSLLDLYIDKLITTSGNDTLIINTPQINSLTVRSNMVRQNQLDGGVLTEPYTSLCMMKGGKLVSRSSDLEELSGMFVLIINDSILHSRESDIKKLIKAYNSSVDFINSHKILHKYSFLSLLSLNTYLPDSVYKIPEFQHATAPSEEALSIARKWADSRKILGDKMKSDIFSLVEE